MNINDMLVFAEVVDSGGFTAAAGRIGRPKSYVSRTVNRLEDSLGIKLLERTTRKQTLTEIGQIYYAHCLRIKEEVESAKFSVESLTDRPYGLLRVSASVTVGQNLIAPQLAEFKKLYPDINVDLRLSNRVIDLFEDNFDVVIRVGKLADSNLIAKSLCTKSLHWYCSAQYIRTHKMPKDDLSDIDNHRCLHMNAMIEKASWTFRKKNETQQVTFKPTFSSDDFLVLRQLAIDGTGIAMLPNYMCDKFVESGVLTTAFNEWKGPTVELHTVVASRRGVTPKTRAFIDYLSNVCGNTK